MITQEQAYALEDLEQATDGLRNHQFSHPSVKEPYLEAAHAARDVAEQELGERTVTHFLEVHNQKHIIDKKSKV